jgi:RNA-binding protein 25
VLTTSKERDLDVRAYLARVVEELKDPIKRQMKPESKPETKMEEGEPDIDEADYVPASTNGGMKVLVSSADEDSSSIPTAQREIILKEIAAFRERSNRRERNKTWFEEEDKSRHDRDQSPLRTDSRRQKDTSDDRRGPRSIEPQENIPLGPAADRRRATREYHQSMRFRASSDRYDRDDDEDIPDDELERRRQDKKKRELEAKFVEVITLFL